MVGPLSELNWQGVVNPARSGSLMNFQYTEENSVTLQSKGMSKCTGPTGKITNQLSSDLTQINESDDDDFFKKRKSKANLLQTIKEAKESVRIDKILSRKNKSKILKKLRCISDHYESDFTVDDIKHVKKRGKKKHNESYNPRKAAELLAFRQEKKFKKNRKLNRRESRSLKEGDRIIETLAEGDFMDTIKEQIGDIVKLELKKYAEISLYITLIVQLFRAKTKTDFVLVCIQTLLVMGITDISADIWRLIENIDFDINSAVNAVKNKISKTKISDEEEVNDDDSIPDSPRSSTSSFNDDVFDDPDLTSDDAYICYAEMDRDDEEKMRPAFSEFERIELENLDEWKDSPPSPSNWDYIHPENYGSIDGDMPRPMAEAMSDDLNLLADSFGLVLESKIVKTVTSLVALLAAQKFFSKEFAIWVKTWVGIPEKKYTTPEAVLAMLRMLATISRAAEMYSKGMPLSKILFQDDPMSATLSQARLLIYQSNTLYFGLPQVDRFDGRMWAVQAQTCNSTLKEFMSLYNPLTSEWSNMSSLSVQLSEKIKDAKAKLGRGTRITPFGVVLHGKPGVGKSSVLDLLYRLWSRHMGREYEDSHVFSRNSFAQFWDGYDVFGTPIVHIPEIGCLHKDIARKTGDDATNEFLAVIDSQAYLLNMSRMEDKSNTYCNPEFVITDTNEVTLNVEVIANHPAALLRRFIFIQQFVKPEYQKDGSCALDPLKTNDDDEMDKWTFDVILKVPTTSKVTKDVYLMNHRSKEGNDVKSLAILMDKLMKAHTLNETRVLEMKKNIDVYKYFDEEKPESKEVHDEKTSPPKSVTERLVERGEEIGNDVVSLSSSVLNAFFEKTAQWNDYLFDPNGYYATEGKEGFDDKKDISDKRAFEMDVVSDLNSMQDGFDIVNTLCHDTLIKTSKNDTKTFDDHDIRAFASSLLGVRAILRSEGMPYECVQFSEILKYCSEHFRSNNLHIYYEMTLEEFRQLRVDLQHRRNECSKPAIVAMTLAWGLKLSTHDYFFSDTDYRFGTDDLVPKEKFVPQPPICLAEGLVGEICPMKFVQVTEWLRGTAQNTVTLVFLFIICLNELIKYTVVNVEKFSTRIRACMYFAYFVSCYYFLSSTWCGIFFFLGCSYAIDPDRLRPDHDEKREQAYHDAKVVLGNHSSDFRDWLFGGKITRRFTTGLYIVVSTLTVAVVINLIYSLVRDSRRKPFVTSRESSSFTVHKPDIPVLEKLQQLEDNLELLKCSTRVKVKNTTVWNTIVTKPPVFTNEATGLESTALRNTRAVAVSSESSSRVNYIHCLGILGNIAIIHKHAFVELEEPFLLSVNRSSKEDETQQYNSLRRYEDMMAIHEDLFLVKLDSVLFSNILKFFPTSTSEYNEREGRIFANKVKATYPIRIEVRMADGSSYYESAIMYKTDHNAPAKCGHPLITTVQGGSYISGVHTAGDGKGYGFSLPLTVGQLEKGLSFFKGVLTNSECSSRIPDTVMVNPKSPSNFEIIGAMELHGKVADCNPNQVSKLRKTSWSKYLDKLFFDVYGFERDTIFVKPMMKPHNGPIYISPVNNAIRGMAPVKKALCPRIMKKSVDQISQQLYDNLMKIDPTITLSGVDFETAINGSDIDVYMRRMDSSKAAGFAFPGKKHQYLYTIELEDGNILQIPKEDLARELIDILEAYDRGESAVPIFSGCLKDEPRSMEKAKIGKTRMFFATPYGYLILCRCVLSALYTLMIQYPEAFYCAIGIDMHRYGHLIREALLEFARNIIEGDYARFDQNMPFGIGEGAAQIAYNLLQMLGFPERHLKLAARLLADALHPWVTILGDLYRVPGLQPSGKYATAEDNCFRNLLMQVYTWNATPELENLYFFDYVLPYDYGDDIASAVKEEVKEFYNCVTYAKFVGEHMGIGFTGSDKLPCSKPFIEIEDLTFLKRSFKFHDGLNRIVCPLDMNSIYRSLEWYIPSKAISKKKQMQDNISSMARELFFWSDEKQFTSFFKEIEKLFYEEFETTVDYPKYYQLLDEYSDNPICSDEKKLVTEGRREHEGSNHLTFAESGVETYPHGKGLLSCLRPVQEDPAAEQRAFDRATIVLSNSKKRSANNPGRNPDEAKGLNTDSDLINQIKIISAEINDLTLPVNINDVVAIRSMRYQKLTSSEKKMQRRFEALNRKRTEIITKLSAIQTSAEASCVGDMVSNEIVAMEKKENLTDDPGACIEYASAGYSEVLDIGQFSRLSLDNFFERPILIQSHLWGVGDLHQVEIRAWRDLLRNSALRSKLRHSATFRANLNIRIGVSGCPFHCGYLMASYQPFPTLNATLTNILSQTGTAASVHQFQGAYLSQAKGVKYIDVKSNQPLDIKIPYISPQPVIRLYNSDGEPITPSVDFEDVVGMGTLYLHSMGPLGCVSDLGAAVSIYVYAWFSEVELGPPTASVITTTAESSSLSGAHSADVEKEGVIPKIMSYVRASAETMINVGKAAAVFGLSTPTRPNDTTRVANEPFSNSSNTTGHSVVKKVTLDPKQELSISPVFCGTDEDDMSFSSICARESYIGTFDWSSEDVPLIPVGDILVHPFHAVAHLPPLSFIPMYLDTPMAFCASAFEWWHGSITFRFHFAASAFHRGRWGIIWDPNNSARESIMTGEAQLNIQNIHIIDLQNDQNFEMTVEWGTHRAWKRCTSSSYTLLDENAGNYCNGFIYMFPLTRLQSPDSNPIKVTVYAHSKDMQFNQLSAAHLAHVRPTDAESSVKENVSIGSKPHGISKVMFGEQPYSFRNLVKRFAAVGSVPTISEEADESGNFIIGLPNYPPMRPGYNGESQIPCNLIEYLRPAYLGMSGGIRHRVSITPSSAVSPTTVAKVSLDWTNENGALVVGNFTCGPDIFNLAMGLNGCVDFPIPVNSAIEYEIPLYSNNLFLFACGNTAWANHPTIDKHGSKNHYIRIPVLGRTGGETLVHDIAGAEDFSFWRFLGSPPHYYGAIE